MADNALFPPIYKQVYKEKCGPIISIKQNDTEILFVFHSHS